MNRDPYSRYHETKILGADQGRLILMAYDGIIKYLQIAIDRLENNDYQGKGKNIIKAQELINELLCSLNLDTGEIAVNLQKLYIFMINKLTQADVEKDVNSIQDILKMLYELQDAWETIILNGNKEVAVGAVAQAAQREAVL